MPDEPPHGPKTDQEEQRAQSGKSEGDGIVHANPRNRKGNNAIGIAYRPIRKMN